MKKNLPLLLTAAAFLMLVLWSEPAAAGARRGLAVCAGTLIPSLFPFFTMANLLSSLGLAAVLSGTVGRAAGRLFRISGPGSQAFLLGLTGGYPLGAAVTARLRRDGAVTRSEGERLLAFCNNSGPAFILGAAGGVFHSPAAGALLYVTHILAAVCVGLVFRGETQETPPPEPKPPMTFPEALPGAVTGALRSTLTVCAYVVLFSALTGTLSFLALLPPLARAMVTGFLELGSGIAALAGLAPTPPTLAGAAFLLGWGGLSVHCQTLGAVSDTDMSCARHLAGRALCGVFAAVFTYAAAQLIF